MTRTWVWVELEYRPIEGPAEHWLFVRGRPYLYFSSSSGSLTYFFRWDGTPVTQCSSLSHAICYPRSSAIRPLLATLWLGFWWGLLYSSMSWVFAICVHFAVDICTIWSTEFSTIVYTTYTVRLRSVAGNNNKGRDTRFILYSLFI